MTCCCRATVIEAQPARPNVVYILVDDLRWDALGCAGHPVVKTPNIDRIAKEGAYFENFFVTTPLCSPARASFLTGLYAHKHGIVENVDNPERSNAISFKLITFPLLLQKAGYETAHVGKWHMGDDDSPRPGFDHWLSFKAQGVYDDPWLNIDGNRVRKDGYVTDLLTDDAVQFIEKPHDKPFVLCLAHKAVHDPFEPATKDLDLYIRETLPERPNVMEDEQVKGKPALSRPDMGLRHDHPTRGVSESIERNQLRCLASVDRSVGKILETLQRTGALDNTFIIFTSDNGYLWHEHGLGNKGPAYEESIRVPLLIRYPKLIKPGTRVPQMVLNVDLTPTLLELGGAPASEGLHGRSFLPLLRGDKPQWREVALFEYWQTKNWRRIPTWQAVRTENYKYIHYPDLQNMDELYDLSHDPYEMNNLINDPANESTLAAMKLKLQQSLQETN